MAAGTILTTELVDGRSGVSAAWPDGWPFTVNQGANVSASGVVDSIDGGGAIVTYTISDGGAGYSVGAALLVGTDGIDFYFEAEINILTVESGGSGSGYIDLWH